MERKDKEILQELAVVGSFLCRLGMNSFQAHTNSNHRGCPSPPWKSTGCLRRKLGVGPAYSYACSSTKYFPAPGISTLSGATTSHSLQVHQWWT